MYIYYTLLLRLTRSDARWPSAHENTKNKAWNIHILYLGQSKILQVRSGISLYLVY